MTKVEPIKGAKFVVIGGGTGSFTLLSGLRHYVKDITALVNMADDGGSTGILRDELGVLPPGDVRQCLVALSDNPQIRDLFNYRFEEGSFSGHAFGNLFITALEKMTGDFTQAVKLAGEVLHIDGRVEPVTTTNVTLCAQGVDGKPMRGEYTIAHAELARTPKVWLEPEAAANPAAVRAIEEADIVVIAPGNLYGSLAPALLVPGIAKALMKTQARSIYVANLVTKPGPTQHYKVHDFADEIERFVGSSFLHAVIYNDDYPDEELLSKYTRHGEYAVESDENENKKRAWQARGLAILAKSPGVKVTKSDPLASTRNLIRHDPDAVARQLMRMYFA